MSATIMQLIIFPQQLPQPNVELHIKHSPLVDDEKGLIRMLHPNVSFVMENGRKIEKYHMNILIQIFFLDKIFSTKITCKEP